MVKTNFFNVFFVPVIWKCVFIVVITMPVLGSSQGPAMGDNLLDNPGFEELINEIPVGWSRYATEGSRAGLLADTNARTGRVAALIDIAAGLSDSKDDVARLAFTQRHLPVESGGTLEAEATYRLSVYYRTEGDPEGRLMVQIKDHRPFPTVKLPPSDHWEYAELEFVFPKAAEWASIGIWANYGSREISDGRIWFDDISLVKVEDIKITHGNVSDAAKMGFELSEGVNRLIVVHNSDQLLQAITMAQPGDRIELADGIYTGNFAIHIHGKHGTKEQPIVIVAQNSGQAEIADRLLFSIRDSSYITIEGLKFTTSGEPSHASSGRGAVLIHDSSHIRVTRNHFSLKEQQGLTRSKSWVSVFGSASRYNRVDHNLFENKLQLGHFVVMHVENDRDTMARHTRIDHNHFRDMVPLGINGMEAIRIGNIRYMSNIDSHTIIEHNLFERVDGERSEIISVKNSSNIIRYNTFLETDGSLTLRYGNRNSVYGNFFIGNGKPGAGGVRIYGHDHRVYNNYFQGLRRPAVWLGSGNADDVMELDETGYVRMNRVDIVFNTFVDNVENIVYQERPTTYPLAPLQTRIANNVIYGISAANPIFGVRYRELMALSGITWSTNIVYAPERALVGLDKSAEEITHKDPQLVGTLDGVYFPDEHSPLIDPAIDVGERLFPYVTHDIEGKPRDRQPDIGAFEYAGLPLIYGPLKPGQVGPHADTSDLLFSPDTDHVRITAMKMIGTRLKEDTWWGPITINIDGIATGSADNAHIDKASIDVAIYIDQEQVQRSVGLPASFVINEGTLDDGWHELTVVVGSQSLRDERSLSFLVQNVHVGLLQDNDVIHGQWPVKLEIGYPEHIVRSVKVSVGDAPLYEGAGVLENLVIDSTALKDGEHQLAIEIERVDGRVLVHQVNFTVRNQWELVDELLPPRDWGAFGLIDQLQTIEKSSGWKHATDHANHLVGDSDRLVSHGQEGDFLTWESPKLSQVTVSLYARRVHEARDRVRLLVSEDGFSYRPVEPLVHTESPAGAGWSKVDLVAELAFTQTTNYFRLEVKPSAGAKDDLQIGKVHLIGRR